MRPSFNPRLINGPFDDPGLFIPFYFQNRALIFDLGDISCLASRELLKISHAFVTHTHMDHFIGFDRLLRTDLGREKTLALFGPTGFIKNVEGKLAGYTWNLVEKYNYPLTLQIKEVNAQAIVCRRFRCSDRFRPDGEAVEQPFNGILYQEPGFTVRAIILDHGIPCLGLAIKEQFHINILKEGLKALALEPGSSWSHNNLGVALAEEGLLDEARRHFSEALRLDPDNESARFNLERAGGEER